jgi:F0F1-type ATP synthase membrane subunit c/vacuolar-type H+-ATPase subunit K
MSLDQRLTTMRILWFALAASLFVYLAVVLLVHGALEPGGVEWNWERAVPSMASELEVSSVLWMMAFPMGLASMMVPGVVFKGPRSGEAGPPEVAIARAFTPWILGLALAESASVFGLVSAIAATTPERFVVPMGISLTMMLRWFPSRETISNLAGLRHAPRSRAR